MRYKWINTNYKDGKPVHDIRNTPDEAGVYVQVVSKKWHDQEMYIITELIKNSIRDIITSTNEALLNRHHHLLLGDALGVLQDITTIEEKPNEQ